MHVQTNTPAPFAETRVTAGILLSYVYKGLEFLRTKKKHTHRRIYIPHMHIHTCTHTYMYTYINIHAHTHTLA